MYRNVVIVILIVVLTSSSCISTPLEKKLHACLRTCAQEHTAGSTGRALCNDSCHRQVAPTKTPTPTPTCDVQDQAPTQEGEHGHTD
jgi:hypothetical protein